MTADNPQDFPYIEKEPTRDYETRAGYWRIASGLQTVDGLQTSEYFSELAQLHSEGKYEIAEVGKALKAYHDDPENARDLAQAPDAVKEADLVGYRIVELLDRAAFLLAPEMLAQIHEYLFQDFEPETYQPGKYKTLQLVKSETILNGDSVLYSHPAFIERTLNYLFDKELDSDYGIVFDSQSLEQFSRFIAQVWLVHPFNEGNTRTVAVFAALYLNHLGFDTTNEPFEKYAVYFRNALVRATYRNAKAQIAPDMGYLMGFFDNLINDANNPLNNEELICQALYDDPSLLRNVNPSEAIQK